MEKEPCTEEREARIAAALAALGFTERTREVTAAWTANERKDIARVLGLLPGTVSPARHRNGRSSNRGSMATGPDASPFHAAINALDSDERREVAIRFGLVRGSGE